MQTSTVRIQIFLAVIAAMLAAWYWAMAPLAVPIVIITPHNASDAYVVREVFHYRLVQPEWVSAPPDFTKWLVAEIRVRLLLVLLAWLACVAWSIRRYLKSRNVVNHPVAQLNPITP